MASSKALTTYAPPPARLEVAAYDLRVMARATYTDLYNEDPDFKDRVDRVPGSYEVSAGVDEWTCARMFADHCTAIGGPVAAVGKLPGPQLLTLFRYLRTKTKTSPASRRIKHEAPKPTDTPAFS